MQPRRFLKMINLENDYIMPDRELMTIEEVADYLRVKKRTVYEWVKNRKIPAIKTVGQWRFKKVQIDTWLESQQG